MWLPFSGAGAGNGSARSSVVHGDGDADGGGDGFPVHCSSSLPQPDGAAFQHSNGEIRAGLNVQYPGNGGSGGGLPSIL